MRDMTGLLPLSRACNSEGARPPRGLRRAARKSSAARQDRQGAPSAKRTGTSRIPIEPSPRGPGGVRRTLAAVLVLKTPGTLLKGQAIELKPVLKTTDQWLRITRDRCARSP